MKRELKVASSWLHATPMSVSDAVPMKRELKGRQERFLISRFPKFQTLSIWRGNWKTGPAVVRRAPTTSFRRCPYEEGTESAPISPKKSSCSRFQTLSLWRGNWKLENCSRTIKKHKFQTLSLWRGNWKTFSVNPELRGILVSDAVPMKRELKDSHVPRELQNIAKFQTLSLWRGNWKLFPTRHRQTPISGFRRCPYEEGTESHPSTG